MATRSLTEVFILMRNNASQNRHIFNDQADDRKALISAAVDIEHGTASMKLSRLPPEWVDGVEEVQFEISRIKTRMKELQQLHDKHLNRPTLDDSADEEHEIEIQTQEITKMFHHCQRLVHQVSAKSRSACGQEEKLTINIVTSMARTVQELSINFKKSQSSYLKKLKGREERSRQFFDTNLSGGFAPGDEGSDELAIYDRGFTDSQLQMVEDNTAVVEQREREINQIVRSIQDLNEIFKDLAGMIVDQGTLLDRIDYNVEQTSVKVEKGLQQLEKATKYQKKNRKMFVIVILAVIVILLLIILIAWKSNK